MLDLILKENIERIKSNGLNYSIRNDVVVVNDVEFYIDLSNDIAIITDINFDNKNYIKQSSDFLKLILLSPISSIQDYIDSRLFIGYTAQRNIKGRVINAFDFRSDVDKSLFTPYKIKMIRISMFK
jgi:hypothetical protein